MQVGRNVRDPEPEGSDCATDFAAIEAFPSFCSAGEWRSSPPLPEIPVHSFFYILLPQKPICLYHNISFLRLPNVYPAQPLAPQGFAGFKGLDFRPFVYLNVYPA